MLSRLETGLGLDIVVWLQAHGSPLLDVLAVLLHYAGQDVVYLVVGLLLYWRMERRLAGQWLFTLIVTSIATDLLKAVVAAPRPYQVAPDMVRILVSQGGYGLPSGHVSHVVAMLGLLAVWYHRRSLWALVVGGGLAMAWARMYLGVHYPQDVIAGALLGILCLWLSLRYFPDAERIWMRLPTPARRVILAVVLILVVIGVISSVLGY